MNEYKYDIHARRGVRDVSRLLDPTPFRRADVSPRARERRRRLEAPSSVDAVHVDAQSPLVAASRRRSGPRRTRRTGRTRARAWPRSSFETPRGRPRTCGTRAAEEAAVRRSSSLAAAGRAASRHPSPRTEPRTRARRRAPPARGEARDEGVARGEVREDGAQHVERGLGEVEREHDARAGAVRRRFETREPARRARAKAHVAKSRRNCVRHPPGGCRPRRRRRRPWRCPPRAARAPRRTRAGAPRSPRAPRP